ncbi:MAG: response regulator [Anaerolineae bacterium]|nr:response regulator [Anaerolineae bacterium]
MGNLGTILIVDDQEIARRTLEVLLRDEDYRLVFAENGMEALSKAVKLVPDLILLDVMMPGMNGFEVCRRLRAHKLLAEVPIIMLTSMSERDARLKGLEAGADDFVVKPFDRVELKTRVRSIMRLNRYRLLLVERVRFRWVVENAEEGYVVVDADDRVLYANPQARFYFGLDVSKDDEIATPFLALAKAHYRCEPEAAWEVWPQPALGNVPRYLVHPETETSRSFWLQVDVLTLPSGPGMAGTVRVRDVTDKMNTLRDMRSFNASITHKLLTPLVHIVGNLDLLAKYYRAEMQNPDIAVLFEMALQGSRRLRHEINQIIQYTRNLPLVTSHQDRFSVADLPTLVTTLGVDLALETLKVVYTDHCSPDVQVVLPRQAMLLILSELLENARKFHPQHTPDVEISLSCTEPGYVSLRVSDNGVSLSPEQLAQVWTPYYQAEKHFTGEVAGMGLGLTMVSTLVWSVGGACRIDNRVPPPGVAITLSLPCAKFA